MKKTILHSLKFTLLILLVAVATQSLTTQSKAKPVLLGYQLTVVAGDISPEHNCGTDYTVWVSNSTDIITTGTHVYINPQCTNPLPDTIIISQSGSTLGQAFYVVNGVVAGSAIPC